MAAKGEPGTAKQRAASDARRAKVTAAKADRASQTARVKAWREGAYPMSEWSDEEVARGRVGSEEGEFYGDKPKLKPKDWKQLEAERKRRAMRTFHGLLNPAIGTFKELLVFGDYATRARVANSIIERNLGKVPDRVVQLDEDPYADMMDDIIEDRSGVDKGEGKRKR